MLSPLILLLLLVEVALPVLLVIFRDHLIFFPSRNPLPAAGLSWVQEPSRIRLVSVVRPDGRALAAYDAHPVGWDPGDGAVVIFFHGNAGNIAMRAPILEAFTHGTEARVLLPDYSGYGGNEGQPGEDEVYRDGLAAYDHIVNEGVRPERIVLYGESLGGAVAVEVAMRRKCAGVVLQSTFASLSSMSLRVYPWIPLGALLVRGRFPSAQKVKELECPVVIAHGKEDDIIPFSEARKLHRAAPAGSELLAVDSAGHNDFFEVAGRPYLETLRDRFHTWVRRGGEESR